MNRLSNSLNRNIFVVLAFYEKVEKHEGEKIFYFTQKENGKNQKNQQLSRRKLRPNFKQTKIREYKITT